MHDVFLHMESINITCMSKSYIKQRSSLAQFYIGYAAFSETG